jgi:hypothetical protein
LRREWFLRIAGRLKLQFFGESAGPQQDVIRLNDGDRDAADLATLVYNARLAARDLAKKRHTPIARYRGAY